MAREIYCLLFIFLRTLELLKEEHLGCIPFPTVPVSSTWIARFLLSGEAPFFSLPLIVGLGYFEISSKHSDVDEHTKV